MTREELHQQVWSQPMRTLAKSMGISDVALAKRCKAANVPVPPRGWWARKEAGKSVKVEPLPPPAFVFANYFPALALKARETAEQAGEDLPGPPRFRDLAAVSNEIRAAVRPIKVPTVLSNPHPIVARLLKQDAERKPSSSPSGYFSSRNAPRFAAPIQQRRLRILSTILNEFARLGCKAQGSTHAGERFSINVGGHWTYIFLGVEGGTDASFFHTDSRAYRATDKERLRLDLVDHDDRTPPKRIWREDKISLEQQVTDIVQGVLVAVEEHSRKWALLSYKWQCEDRERKIREAKAAAEKAEADRVAREKADAAARLGALLGGAGALEQAAQIRRYVAAVRTACSEKPELGAGNLVDRWADWALAEADAIDPVISGKFLANISG